ncbi:alpha/beta fold hydrolase [Allonocardiopsis opalescens]|uniref:Alpha/beta hydrolase family protein n=1 Tax=Allonocardiopsis opalescens TaxID=1144618 RepID=A0A2T0QDL7_9ACTN|nr:alpha/beta hydrolase [Allonocardiopsis opalescens]PRY01998.1 alpha/beta hydrolase family protein [Allonocardiopsis opalescens]
MAVFAVVHGGGGSAWEWHLVAADLAGRGHDVVAVDLPVEDPGAGLSEFAGTVADALGARARRRDRAGAELVVVGHSLGAFTAALLCGRVEADLLVLVAGMVPAPGEAAQEWWEASGYQAYLREHGAAAEAASGSEAEVFTHDVPPGLAAEALRRSRDQSARSMEEPWGLVAWPPVPTRALLCRDDRFFPAEFMRRLVRERLGIAADEMGGGHMPMLARPAELAERLDGYARSLAGPARVRT